MSRLFAVVCLVGLAAAAFAAKPVAKASSPATFELSGVSMPVAGTPSWPVIAGDEITTGKAPVVLSFDDGSRVTLATNSSAKIESGAVSVVRGGGWYELASGSALKILVLGKTLEAVERSGTFSTGPATSKPPQGGLSFAPTPQAISTRGGGATSRGNVSQ